MHLHTIVKVQAASAKEAVERVKDLITCEGEYSAYGGYGAFDYCGEDETQISKDITNEEQFKALRVLEIEEYEHHMKQADALPITDSMKGYHLRKAGESLSSESFWSTERLAYEIDWLDGKKTYYVETDRHY